MGGLPGRVGWVEVQRLVLELGFAGIPYRQQQFKKTVASSFYRICHCSGVPSQDTDEAALRSVR